MHRIHLPTVPEAGHTNRKAPPPVKGSDKRSKLTLLYQCSSLPLGQTPQDLITSVPHLSTLRSWQLNLTRAQEGTDIQTTADREINEQMNELMVGGQMGGWVKEWEDG